MTFWPDSFRSAKSFFDEMSPRRVQLQFQTKASPTDFLDQAKMDKKQMICAAASLIFWQGTDRAQLSSCPEWFESLCAEEKCSAWDKQSVSVATTILSSFPHPCSAQSIVYRKLFNIVRPLVLCLTNKEQIPKWSFTRFTNISKIPRLYVSKHVTATGSTAKGTL